MHHKYKIYKENKLNKFYDIIRHFILIFVKIGLAFTFVKSVLSVSKNLKKKTNVRKHL